MFKINSVRSLSLSSLIIFGGLLSVPVFGNPQVDKSKYNIFNPTPRHEMREMVTDRPDKTESPITVDAGHFQIEADLVNYSREKTDDTISETYQFWLANYKIGLTHRSDLQIITETQKSFRQVGQDTNGSVNINRRNFGDTTVRFKQNILSPDGEHPLAIALMPYVKFPTNQGNLGNKKVEYGLIVPFATDLPEGWGMAWMFQYDQNKNDNNDSMHSKVVTSMTIGRNIMGDLSFYVEYWGQSSTMDGASFNATGDIGFTYLLCPDVQLDTGVNMGLTNSADDTNVFAGLSFRW